MSIEIINRSGTALREPVVLLRILQSTVKRPEVAL